MCTVNLSHSGSLPLTDRWNSAFQMGGLVEPKRERNGVTERRVLTFSTLQGEKAGLQKSHHAVSKKLLGSRLALGSTRSL